MKMFGDRFEVGADSDVTARKRWSRPSGMMQLALLGILALVLVLLPAQASAVHELNLFELDGNAVVDHAGPGTPDDWSRVFDPTTFGAGGWFDATFLVDGSTTTSPADHDYFTGGGSKDTHDVGDWMWTPTPTPSAPDKDEILDAYGAGYINPADSPTGVLKKGDTILYFGMDRYDNSGDSNVGFWFVQDPAFGENSDGTFSGHHTNGDLLVLSAFGNGGSQPDITLYEWQGDAATGGLVQLGTSGTSCTGGASEDTACAEVNGAAIQVPWDFTDKSGDANHTVAQNEFFEGGVDVNSIYPAGTTLPCFAKFVGETRSSDSTSSQLKDLVIGNLNSCGSIELKKHWDGLASSTTLQIGTTVGGHDVAQKTVTADDTTGAFEEHAGTYYVSESPNPPTTHYTTTLACENDKTDPATPVTPGSDGSVSLTTGDVIVCTYTNTFVKQTSSTDTLSNPQGGSVVPGTQAKDNATVTGILDGPAPTGTVTFFLCGPDSSLANDVTLAGCPAGTGTQIGSVVGLTATSPQVNPPTAKAQSTLTTTAQVDTAGKYCWRAEYSGDDFYNSSTHTDATNECFTTVKQPSSTTTASSTQSSTVVPGTSVTDTATVTGSGATPTGTVDFFLCQPAQVTTNGGNCSAGGTQVGSAVQLDGSGHATSAATTDTTAIGTYCWRAVYSGDSFHNGSSELTSSHECFTTVKQPSTTTTASSTQSSSVLPGTSVTDTATVSGGAEKPTPTGTVTFIVCQPAEVALNGGDCHLGGTQVGSAVQLDGSGHATSAATTNTNSTGTYCWRAVYGGDNFYNGSSELTSSHECFTVVQPAIAITKSPATQPVDSGGTANFTIVVTNTGTVTLINVTVTDPLSLGCVKTIGTLTPGQSFSYTCSQTGVTAAFTNVATATGHPPVGPDVTASASANVTVNSPPPPETPTPTPTPTPTVDLAIVKTASPASLQQGGNVTYTLTVTNNGPVTDTGVQIADSLPAGVTFVSVSTTVGTCTGGNLVQCTIGTMTNGQTVTITIVATAVSTGTIVDTATVVGNLPETTLANNSSSATITVTAPPAPKPASKPVAKPAPKPAPKPVFKPPVVKKPAPPVCYTVVVTPKTLTVDAHGVLRLRVTARNKPVAGTRLLVKGPGIVKLSGRTNAAGRVVVTLDPKKAGFVLVKPAAYKSCTAPRVGVIGVFTPPVTG
jgi:uncharacterized repeat protein (TIGR01451 family)